jgi:hypothetical protein
MSNLAFQVILIAYDDSICSSLISTGVWCGFVVFFAAVIGFKTIEDADNKRSVQATSHSD